MPKPKIQISWSGGKDSALALYRIQQLGMYDIVGLHTVFDKDTKRVGIHNVPEHLIEAQADLLQLPLTKLYLPKKPMAYEKLMRGYYQDIADQGVNKVMFGDIFLDDLKDFREQLLRPSSTAGVYPLWKENTILLTHEFLDAGFMTKLCAVDSKYISSDYVGEYLSKDFIHTHAEIDACGENGEYHSLVVAGPNFRKPLSLKCVEKYEQDFSFKVKDEKGKQEELKDQFYFAEFELSANN